MSAHARCLMQGLMRFALLALLVAGAGGDFAKAESYPARPVTLIVPFAPGGGTELLARTLGQRLEQRLDKPFVIENRPGAGGVTGALAVARAAADGYTILMAPAPVMAINVTLHKKLPYDPATDFVPLALLVASPYRGSVPALTDVAAGHVQLMFSDVPPARGLIAEGKVRALAVSTKERVAVLPDVPTIAESAVPGFDAASWQMVVAPAGTPRHIVERLHGEIRSIMAQPDVKEQIAKQGLLPVDTPSVASLQVFVKTEIARWGAVVQQAGIAGSQ
jgi:tripartite-type tricarboxylate transporter receptor subunit TctC